MSTCLAILLSLPAHAIAAPEVAPAGDPCTQTAEALRRAAVLEIRSDLLVDLANCLNLLDEDDREDCTDEAWEDYYDALEEADEQYEARVELCELLGGGAYDPEIDPDDFVSGLDHRFFRFPAGVTKIYQKQTDEGLEQSSVHATGKTIEILGVECSIVRDTETLDGEIVEDTFDYFAQDSEGNVWYFGELSLSFEDGQLEGIGGSWRAGEDGAKPGIIMKADPVVGETYRQEFLLTEAEDAGTVLALGVDVDVPYGSFSGCLKTADFSPLEPGDVEHKFYAPGIGLVREFDPADGESLELVAIETP